MAVWWMRLLHLSRTEARYLVGSMTYGVVWEQVCLRHASAASCTGVPGVHCLYGRRHGHLWCDLLPPRPHRPLVQVSTTPTFRHHAARGHWLPIAVDGTSRPKASNIRCTLGGTASPNQLSGWWLRGHSEKWETLYAASQETDFDDELHKAATVSFKDTEGNARRSHFVLCADGKAQVLMAGCQNWKAKSPGATMCWVCMRSRALCLGARVGTNVAKLLRQT